MRRTCCCLMLVAVILWATLPGCGESEEEGTGEVSPIPSQTPISSSLQAIDKSIGLEGKSIASTVPFESGSKIVSLEVEIELDLAREGAATTFINAGPQTFQGLVAGKRITGTLKNEVNRYSGKDAPSFNEPVPDDLQAYLEPGDMIESDDPLVIERASDIAFGTPDTWMAADAVAQWVNENITNSNMSVSAGEALSGESGDFGSQAYLTVALCRAIDIPARVVGGLAYSGGMFAQHYWVECHMGQAGWIPLDPPMGQYGWVDAAHLRLFEDNDIAAISALEVVGYSEVAPAPGTEDEFGLGPGESRQYVFAEEGTEFGTSSYAVTGLRGEGGADAYEIETTIHLEPSGVCKPTEVQATLTIDDGYDPLAYRASPFNYGEPGG